MSKKVHIRARDFVEDLRSGMDDSRLRNKYQLSTMGLESVFKKLLDAGVISGRELAMRPTSRNLGPVPSRRR